jgi:5'(3')-deoxyribonucleotidase
MRIIIDVDNTICDTNQYFFYNCKVRFSRHDLIYDGESLSDYHITHWFVDNDLAEEIEALAMKEQIFNDVFYWESIPPKKDAIEVIERLNKKHTLLFATDAITIVNEAPLVGKKRWFKRFMPFVNMSQLVFIRNKSLLRADMIIEDQIDQVKDFKGEVILFNYSYNKDYKDCYRVTDWKMLEELLEKVVKCA